MDLVSYYRQRNQHTVRTSLKTIRDAGVEANCDLIHDALDFATCRNDFEQVKLAMKSRYATIIKGGVHRSGDSDIPTGYEHYTVGLREGESAKFDIGHYATMVTGVMQTIARTLACLFTSPFQRWQFLRGGVVDQKVEQTVTMHRATGNFEISLTECDYIASCVDSSLMHVFLKGEWLAYECVWPSDVRIIYPKQVVETTKDGRVVPRSPDRTDIEDAAAVIIRVGKADDARDSTPDLTLWTAYVGSNVDNVYGRMVTYQQSVYWPIPPVGDASIVTEYSRKDVGVCNPMTHVAKTTTEGVGGGYEYPVAVIRGDRRLGAAAALPMSTSLYQCSVEIEKQWSHLLHNADACASGVKVLNVGQGDPSLPKSLDVVVLKGLDQTFKIESQDSNGVKQHLEVVTTATRSLGASRGVPPYITIGSAPSVPESGFHLAIRTQPLIEGRNLRISMNRQSIGKIFYAEQALLTEIEPEFEQVFKDARMLWDAGEWVPPQDPGAATDEALKQRDARLIDQFEAMRRVHALPTIQDAIALDKEFSRRDADYVSADPETRAAKALATQPKPSDEVHASDEVNSSDEVQ